MRLRFLVYVGMFFLLCGFVNATTWWNDSYNYHRNITGVPSSSLIFPINGTNRSDIDNNGFSEWLYGLASSGDLFLYYNDENDSVLVNSSDDVLYLFQTEPVVRKHGSPPSKDFLLAYYPLDNDDSVMYDFSANNINGTIGSSSVQGFPGVFGNAYNFTATSGESVTGLYSDFGSSNAQTFTFWMKPNVDYTSGCSNIGGIWTYGVDNNNRASLITCNGGTLQVFMVDGGSEKTTSFSADFFKGNWYFISVILNSTGRYLYVNGELNESDTSKTETLKDMAIGGSTGLGGHWWNGIGYPFNGTLDDFRIYNTTLSARDIQLLYNASLEKVMMLGEERVKNFPPSINITAPVNNTHDNQPLFINFTYTDYEGDSGNCTVFINNSAETRVFSNVANGSWRNYTSNMSSDGNYYFYVNCTDNNSNSVSTGKYYFVYDTLNPQVDWIKPSDNSTLLSLSNTTFNLVLNFSDANLYKTLINITDSDGVSKWYNLTENITATSDFHNHTINISSWGVGKYTIRAEATDDHTFGPLRGLTYGFSEGELILSKGDWEKHIFVGYYLNGDYSLLSSQQIRNYDVRFSAGIVNQEIKFNLSFTRPVTDVNFGFAIPKKGLVVRDKSKGHFVWKDWYIDFSDMLKSGFKINFLETEDYYVIYTSTKYCKSAVGETCIFDPLIGGLNNVSSERYFVIDAPAVVNFINISPSPAYYYDNLSCSFSAYHSLNDINISAYWLVNNSVVWGVNITDAIDNSTYNISLDSSYVEPNSNIYCYVNVTDGYVLQSNHSNITVGDLPPNITGWYPVNLSFNVSEGTNQTFNVTAFDDSGVVWYKWLLDGIVKAFTRVWEWVTGYESAGVHNVTVVVNDTSNQTASKSWDVTVTNVNIAPVINSLTSSETVVYQNYPNVTIYCNVTDEDTGVENLTVEIEFRDSDDLFWRDTDESYSDGLWVSEFDPEDVDLGYVDIRCKANDGDLDSDWYAREDYIIVYEAQYAPTTPTELMPVTGSFDYTIPVTCSGATDNNTGQIIYYVIQYSVEGGGWSLLSNNTVGMGFFDMAENMEYNETVDFRCKAVDSVGWNSSWFNPSGSVTRKKSITLFLFEPSLNSYYVAYTPKQLGVHGSVRGLDNISIVNAFIDCNGDGIWDYFTDNTTENGWDANKTVVEFDEYYWCAFKPGLNYVEVGMTLSKPENMNWPDSLSVCSHSISDECRLVREYPVWVMG